ncbi:MAG: MarR family transcriptional regulator [Oscillospiraceae bacterium]|nr:MarR family transcriptional regulator [Oscillospiraceae bacterium]
MDREAALAGGKEDIMKYAGNFDESEEVFFDFDEGMKVLSEKINISDDDNSVKTSIYIGMLMRLVHNNLLYNMNLHLKKFDLTSPQFEIILFLISSEGKEINQKDIERRFNLKNPTVTGLLKRLEGKGFIKRYVSEHDARYKRIELTEKAEVIRDDMYNSLFLPSRGLYDGISEEEKIRFIKILIKFNKNILKLNEQNKYACGN